MRTEELLPEGILDDSTRAYAALVDRFDYLDPTVVLVDLLDRVDASALPTLLAQFHVDFLRAGAGEEDQREKVKASVDWHRRKGTPDAVAGLVADITGIAPAVRERRYFLLGRSALGLDEISKPPRPGFRVGQSQLGVAGLGLPDMWFTADVVLDSGQAAGAGVTAADVTPLVAAAKPARTWATVRFSPMRLGQAAYCRLGVDTF